MGWKRVVSWLALIVSLLALGQHGQRRDAEVWAATPTVRQCDQYEGADAGAKIAACVADLPAEGGIADATKLTDAQEISSTLTLSASNVRLELGAATYVLSPDVQIVLSGSDDALEGQGEATILDASAGSGGTVPLSVAGPRAEVSNLKIIGNRLAGGSATTLRVTSSASDALIRGVHSVDAGSGGIRTDGAGVHIENCQIETSAKGALVIFGPNTVVSGNRITNTNVTGATVFGGIVAFTGADDSVISGNFVSSVQGGGIAALPAPGADQKPYGVLVKGNTVDTTHGVSTEGITVGPGWTVTGNRVRNTWVTGILVFGAIRDAVIENNVISDVSQIPGEGHAGIKLRDNNEAMEGIVVRGNVVFDDQPTPTTSYAVGLSDDGAGSFSNITIENNVARNTIHTEVVAFRPPRLARAAIQHGNVWKAQLYDSRSTFADLGAPADGTFIFCTDCVVADLCADGGTGALAKALNGVWVCN